MQINDKLLKMSVFIYVMPVMGEMNGSTTLLVRGSLVTGGKGT